MRPVYIYISLISFMYCLTAPTLAVLGDFNVKETKVANVFDMQEEEDTRDSDSETEKESDALEKLFKSFFASFTISIIFKNPLIHYHFYQRFLSNPILERVTPPPRRI